MSVFNINGHVWVGVPVNNIAWSGMKCRMKCRYCGVSVNFSNEVKCLSDEEKIIKDIIE